RETEDATRGTAGAAKRRRVARARFRRHGSRYGHHRASLSPRPPGGPTSGSGPHEGRWFRRSDRSAPARHDPGAGLVLARIRLIAGGPRLPAPFDLRSHLYRMAAVDFTSMERFAARRNRKQNIT